jgi:hypothetical protein
MSKSQRVRSILEYRFSAWLAVAAIFLILATG